MGGSSNARRRPVVSVASLPDGQLKRIARQIADPDQQDRVVTYLEGRERNRLASRKKKRKTAAASRRRNRR